MAKFRTRARTVDMLGRQQIAGASTAISELFKNAHDAYADNAEVDLFRSDRLLAIRDDGVGMTREEFEDRWLVLGTESRLAAEGESVSAYRPRGKPERTIMGEKGIGRLAIAILGPQVLILTRAEREDGLHDLVVCYIHWGLFEVPAINLDQIEIPVKTFSGGTLPDADDIAGLVSECRESVEELRAGGCQYDFTALLSDLDDFQIDPLSLDGFLRGPSLGENGHGTHFYIAPASEAIGAEIDAEENGRSKEFSKFLLGFCNSTFVDASPPPVRTAFRHWRTDSDGEDLVGPGEFFTTEELEAADHLIRGRVDEFGQFKGSVRVYEEDNPDHVIPWREGGGRQTRCGPFEIEFGYIQGNQRESRLPQDDWARMVRKLDNIGGLYVYRDRIRILPYGNSDVDYVDIEQRRNKSYGYYFFSYRRMFGAVSLTRGENGALSEKAGREGFQRNKAYREFISILENIFIQLAADFFRQGSEGAEFFYERRNEIERLELARRHREKRVNSRKRALANELDGFFQRTNQELPATEVSQLRNQTRQRMETATRIRDPEEASEALLQAERQANARLEEIRQSYRVTKPRGVGLSRPLQREWDAYCGEQERLERDVFQTFEEEVAETLGKMAEEAKLLVDQRKRVEELLHQLAEQNRKTVQHRAKEVRETAEDTTRKAARTASDSIQEFKKIVAEVESDFARRDLSSMEPQQIEHVRRKYESKIEDVGHRNTETLAKIRDMLAGIAENLREGVDISQFEAWEALESDLEGLREQSDLDAELVQLGLAIAIINHEFEAAIKSVRASLRELRGWAAENETLAPLYQEIRNNFDHLDGHLNLFTPLQRRLYREPIAIKGGEINHYARSLFEVRFARHEVELTATQAFLDTEVRAYPSTLYPVFVNVIDNAIFWLRDCREEKKILLDTDGRSYLVSNNGPSVHPRDHEAMFEQGFTRKPGGRGLGLFISRKTLRKERMDIELLPSEKRQGTTFRITWPDDQEDSDG